MLKQALSCLWLRMSSNLVLVLLIVLVINFFRLGA